MGRELKRKEAKKNGQDIKKVNTSTELDWKKIVITFSVIVIFVVVIYFILAVFVTKEVGSNNTTNTSDNSSNNTVANPILASDIFKESEDSYYVYCFDFDEQDTNISNIISNKLVSDKVYRVNTKDSLNKNYVSEVGNKNATSLEDLKISNPSLIKIENGSITMFLVGKQEIINYYNN